MLLLPNELIFIIQSLVVASAALIALRIGSAALIAVIATQAVFANLFVIKQICLCTFHATASDAYAIGGLLALNLLQEYYGKAPTRQAIGISFFCMLLFLVVSQLHLLYEPSIVDVTHGAYCEILSYGPRIIIASFVTYLIVQLFDAMLYGFLKRTFKGRFYITRNYISVMISQLFDTILFSFLGLYGIIEHIWDIIIVSYVIKLLIVLLATPFMMLSRYIMSKKA